MIEVDVIIQSPLWYEVRADIEPYLEGLCKDILSQTGVTVFISHSELSVTLTDDAAIRVLNKRYRHKDSATNVLSFPASVINPEYFDQIDTLDGYAMLGDIVLSIETLRKEAQEQDKSLEAHFTHLLVHGILHLLGYDHETDEEAAIMEQCEVDILAHFGIPSPYGT